jgi:hypothetical protein
VLSSKGYGWCIGGGAELLGGPLNLDPI